MTDRIARPRQTIPDFVKAGIISFGFFRELRGQSHAKSHLGPFPLTCATKT